jgi:hypothetical protein
MSAPHVFCGPSLPPALARELYPQAVVHGPAECGDVYVATRSEPSAIGIVDGYFDHRLSVWHKEILWAISQGIPVYGAASMGALRAAELARYGMVGVGAIYEGFQRRELEDDDEVAVIHGPEERGYPAHSHALVNIRATLREARVQALLDAEHEARIISAAKALNYPERLFERAVEAAGLSAGLRAELAQWFARHGLLDQKRADATELLARMRHDLDTGRAKTVPIFHFETTNYWCLLKARLDQPAPAPREAPGARSEGAAEHGRALLEALEQRRPERTAEVWGRALERALALAIAGGQTAEASAVQERSENFRRALGLLTPESTASWLADNGLDVAGFSALMHDNVLASRFEPDARDLALGQVESVLRTLGLFAEAARALDSSRDRGQTRRS